MGKQFDTRVEVTEGQDGGAVIITLDGTNGEITSGGNGQDGDLTLRDGDGNERMHLNAEEGNVRIGGHGADGDVFLENGDDETTIFLNAEYGNARLGGKGEDGDLILWGSDDNERMHLNAEEGNVRIGGHGEDGDIFLENGDDETTILLNAEYGNARLGGNGQDGDIFLWDGDGNERIHLDAQTGDIRLSGADCAEHFDVADGSAVDPGSVLVAEEDRLQPSTEAYDPRVAGIVSGAGTTDPGIRLDHRDGNADRCPVALVGKAFCKVDTEYGDIEVGDMLTTSPREGYAMKADDRKRAFGATLGKALRSHRDGRGLIPVLVTLQ